MSTVFLRLLDRPPDEKAYALDQITAGVRGGACSHGAWRSADPQSFRKVPRSPFAYWVGEEALRKFAELSPLENGDRVARLGLNTTLDTRFLRTFWEVPSVRIGKRWFPIFKGGGFAPFFAGSPLVVDWEGRGERLKSYIRSRGDSPSRNVRSESSYFRPGLTYSSRTQKGLAFQPLPGGCIFTVKGPAVFPSPSEDPAAVLGLVNSRPFRGFVALQMAFGSYEVGVVQRTPVPDLTGPQGKNLAALAR